MQKVITPQKFGDKDDSAANLQDALLVLIKKGHLKLEPLAQAN